MGESIKDKIFNAFDSGKTLVFTSEVVAENWMAGYLKEGKSKKAIFKDKAISWDSFKLLLVNTDGKHPVDSIARRAFASKILEDENVFEKLRFFSNKEKKESKKSYASAIAGYVQYFAYFEDFTDDVLAGKDKEEKERILLDITEMKDDISLIKPLYEKFLSDNNLYEYNYLYQVSKANIPSMNFDDYFLVFPETFNDPDIVRNVRLNSSCHALELDKVKGCEVIEYENSITEIRDVLRNIRGLMTKDNIKSYDIAITCANLNAYRPFLEDEAKKLDLKLRFTSERPMTHTPQGQFFLALDKIRKENFSFDSINNLLLNPVFPFDREYVTVNRRIIDYAVDTKMINGPAENWLLHIRAAGDPDIRPEFGKKDVPKFKNADADAEYFAELAGMISGIINAKTAQEIITNTNIFIEKYFSSSVCINKEENRNNNVMWAKCTALLLNLQFYSEDENLWNLFMDNLEDASYIDKLTDGIPVYRYPVSTGLCVPYHFVIGLCDDKTIVSFDKYPYWTGKKNSWYAPVLSTDATLNILCYPSLSSHLQLSGTSKMFDGSHLLPISLLNNVLSEGEGKKIFYRQMAERLNSDYYKEEKTSFCNRKQLGEITQNQKRGFSEADEIVNRKPTVFPEPEHLQGTEKNKNISASYFKSYAKCPYMGFINIYMRPDEKKFIPQDGFQLILGDILHEAIQHSLEDKRSHGSGFWSLDRDTLNDNLRKAIKEHSGKFEICSKAEENSIYGKYSRLLPSIANPDNPKTTAFIPEDAVLYDNEVEYGDCIKHKSGLSNYLQIDGLNIAVGGRPDTILKYSQDGETKYILLDYKTTGTEDYDNDLAKCSPQLAVYARMIEKNERAEGNANAKVTHGAYYSIGKEDMKIVWPKIEYKNNMVRYQGHFLTYDDDVLCNGENLKKDEQYVDDFLNRLFDDFRNSVNSSFFEKSGDADICAECRYRNICRKEFIIR